MSPISASSFKTFVEISATVTGDIVSKISPDVSPINAPRDEDGRVAPSPVRIRMRSICFTPDTAQAVKDILSMADTRDWIWVSFLGCTGDASLVLDFIVDKFKDLNHIEFMGYRPLHSVHPIIALSRMRCVTAPTTDEAPHKSLESIMLNCMTITREAADALHNQLRRAPFLKHLDLSGCTWMDDACDVPIADPRRACSLQCLKIQRNHSAVAQQASFLRPFLINMQLQQLKFRSNPLTPQTMELLTRVLESSPTSLQELDLSNCWTVAEDGTKLTHANLSNLLHHAGCLRELDISRMVLHDDSVTALAELIASRNCGLQNLNVSNCGMTKVAGSALGTALGSNGSLMILKLVGNSEIGIGGARTYIQSLRKHTQLRVLFLPTNLQFMYYDRIAYYLSLNVAGRELLSQDLPPGLWAEVLGRCQRIVPSWSKAGDKYYCRKEDLVYHFLRSSPHIVGACAVGT